MSPEFEKALTSLVRTVDATITTVVGLIGAYAVLRFFGVKIWP